MRLTAHCFCFGIVCLEVRHTAVVAGELVSPTARRSFGRLGAWALSHVTVLSNTRLWGHLVLKRYAFGIYSSLLMTHIPNVFTYK